MCRANATNCPAKLLKIRGSMAAIHANNNTNKSAEAFLQGT